MQEGNNKIGPEQEGLNIFATNTYKQKTIGVLLAAHFLQIWMRTRIVPNGRA